MSEAQNGGKKMERLTIPDVRVDEHTTRRTIIDARVVREHAMDFYWRLKAYEDTGLTVEEIDMDHEAAEQLRQLCRDCDLDRLEKLAEADKDGRLVVLPVRPVLTQSIGSMLYIIEDGEIVEDSLCEALVGMGSNGEINIFYTTLSDQISFEQADIGKTVFLTREEAKKALEAMKDGC